MDEIRWGIIGCGDVTEVKSGPALQQARGSKLVAVMRRNGKLAEDYARRHNVGKWFDDADSLINDRQVDAVYVATPPSSHKEYVIAAAKAGRCVYVEKPMALNFDECNEMVKVCQENEVPLFVAYYRRALPRFIKIKSLLEQGAIGDARFVNVTFYLRGLESDVAESNWRVDPQISGGGYFYDLGSHTIDIIQFLLGDAKSAKGHYSNQAGRYRGEDMVSGSIVLAGDVHVSCVWNFNSYENLDRTEIVGDKGKLVFSTFGETPILLENQDGMQEFHIDNPLHIQQPLIQTIVDELLGSGECPSTGRTGGRTNWVMDRMFSEDV